MIFRKLAALMLPFAVAVISTAVPAQDETEATAASGGWYIGGHGAYSILRDGDATAAGTPFRAEHDNGSGLGLSFGYDFDALRAELELQHLGNDYAAATAANINSGDIQSQFLFGNVWFPFGNWGIEPFAGVGFGYGRRDLGGADDWGTALQVGVGADWPLADRWTLTGLYRIFDSESVGVSSGGQRYETDYEGQIVSFGVRYDFADPLPPPPPPAPVEVVKPLPACGDGQDNDDDGLVDYPDDPGCTDADDNNEVDPCKSPGPGEVVDLKGCATGDKVTLRGVNFDLNKATLTADSSLVLDNVAEQLLTNTHIRLEVGGHTDSTGADTYNQDLSERRANSVRDYLVSMGIEADRLTAVGYGEVEPVKSNDTREGRAENRRVELKIL